MWVSLVKIYENVANRTQVFFCGNGGSAGNAVHLANDFLYGMQSVQAQV